MKPKLRTALFFCLPLAAEPVTFSKHIAPILFEYCAPCHRPGEAGPFSLLSYGDARKRAAQIVQVTQRRYMPPWLPAPGHGEFVGERRLSNEQLTLLARWVQSGAPEGNLNDLPPAPQFAAGWQLGEPDLVLHMRQPYPLTATPGDVFRNFVLPVDLQDTKYIRAIELRPGNKRVVHHANLIVDHARMLRRRDGVDGQPGFAGMEVETEVTGEFDPATNKAFVDRAIVSDRGVRIRADVNTKRSVVRGLDPPLPAIADLERAGALLRETLDEKIPALLRHS